MGKPGPRTQPTKLKVLRGNPGIRKLPEGEVEPESTDEVPKAPDYLDDTGRAEWDRVAGVLHSTGLLTIVDHTALGGYCAVFSVWRKAVERIKDEGAVKTMGEGYEQQTVHMQIMNKAQVEMRKWLAEFGMTPSSRVGLKVDKPKEKSKADKFKSRKKG